ncbi:hypothetical protein QTG54_007656 [Skeletonema marinoi]|uniref:Uncharacterized protein n=1 Tax=Skeletonema marinoi TaxID=267567 RepID=A0AAD8YA97_9STRA|nr:hypothetical protein QTG54_007656 [Skeletonema marinoi]
MLNRIRASVAGETPDSPRHTSSSAAHNNNSPSPSTPQRGGLFGFLVKQSSAGSIPQQHELPPPPHGISSHEKGITPMGPSAGGFFGGLIGGGTSSSSPAPPSPSVEPDSPRTIRASAAALLKFSSTPPLFHNNESSNNNNIHSDDNTDNSRNNNTNDALEEQINKRDQHIMKLEHDLQKLQHQQTQLTKDTATIRRQQLESTHRHAVAIRLWRRTNDGLASRVTCFDTETTPAAAKEIAALIRDAAPGNKDSSYLMMLQDQLAKATIKLDHLASQTEIVLQKGEEVVESLREEMNEVIRERCRMEIELMDQEEMLEEEMKRLVLRTERRLKRVMGEIDFLEKNAVMALKNQEEEEDGNSVDNDDEEEEDNKSKKVGGEKIETEKAANEKESTDETDATTEITPQPAGVDDGTNTRKSNNEQDNNKKEEDQSPEVLRQELRRIAMERDRCLSVLQKKLRDKNEEFNALMKLKESRTKAIDKIETERREREEWKRGRQEIIA